MRPRLSALLLLLDWFAFIAAFALTCSTQRNVLWWLRLDWSGWVGELAELTTLGTVSAGFVWILWLGVTLLWSALWFARPAPANAKPAAAVASAAAARQQLAPVASMMEMRPELKDKILRLHQSLEKI